MVDVAFSRIFYARLKLGLLDPPGKNPYTKIPRSAANSWAHRALAISAASKGVVLLENTAGVLPLRAGDYTTPGSLAVVGPNAAKTAYGNYAGNNANNTTPLQGMQVRGQGPRSETPRHWFTSL